jgi:hypothetical protein
MRTIDQLLSQLRRSHHGASLESLRQISESFSVRLPSDYVDFMCRANGGEGPIGAEGYIELWSVEEIPTMNQAYEARDAYPGHLLIGSNRGGEAIAIRNAGDGTELVLVPLIGDAYDAVVGGTTFQEFLAAYAEHAIL